MKFVRDAAAIIVLSFNLAACSPEIGSEEWCADLKDKPKGEWLVKEFGDYTKHCLFK